MPGINTVPADNRSPAGEVWPNAHEDRQRTNSSTLGATLGPLVCATAEAGPALCADGVAPGAKRSPYTAAPAATVSSTSAAVIPASSRSSNVARAPAAPAQTTAISSTHSHHRLI